ncbi:MAG: phosphonoacetaldehyde hydrolase [Planctomycetales bacterium]|nr:phosphonoacetaldehyde hydrolase [Planctomycetales bacterium]
MNRTPLQAVVLDWAGTTVDFGSRAPAQVFVEIFRARGVEITNEESREPMGMSKIAHIQAVTEMPRVAALWEQTHGRRPTAADVQSMYDDFLPMQREALRTGSDVIPGVPDAIEWCRQRGLKIGSSTGYTQALMEVVSPLASQQGYAPDALVCSDDVRQGRPAPFMNFRAAELLGVFPMSAVLVVDDTTVGIEAGRHAGSPTVAVTDTGNLMGLTAEQLAALDESEQQQRREAIRQKFIAAGADFVIPSVAQLPELIEQILSC